MYCRSCRSGGFGDCWCCGEGKNNGYYHRFVLDDYVLSFHRSDWKKNYETDLLSSLCSRICVYLLGELAMTIKPPSGPIYHPDMIQGSEEWIAARCGLLTASEMKLIITPVTLKPAKNDKASAHLYELLAQRITGYVEPRYISEDMLRGTEDELEAREIYAKHYNSVTGVGFITNSQWGFTLGYSPDGLVGDDGLIECKSRRQKFQVETIISNAVPDEHVIQIQSAFLITGRAWCDYVSYCGGMPLAVIRVEPDEKIMNAILAAATAFEDALAEKHEQYKATLEASPQVIETERRIEKEMFV